MDLYKNITNNLKESTEDEGERKDLFIRNDYGDWVDFMWYYPTTGKFYATFEKLTHEEALKRLEDPEIKKRVDDTWTDDGTKKVYNEMLSYLKNNLKEAVEIGYDDYYDFENDGGEDTLYCDECGQPVKADFCYVSDENDPNPEIYCWPCHDKLVANGSLMESAETNWNDIMIGTKEARNAVAGPFELLLEQVDEDEEYACEVFEQNIYENILTLLKEKVGYSLKQAVDNGDNDISNEIYNKFVDEIYQDINISLDDAAKKFVNIFDIALANHGYLKKKEEIKED